MLHFWVLWNISQDSSKKRFSSCVAFRRSQLCGKKSSQSQTRCARMACCWLWMSERRWRGLCESNFLTWCLGGDREPKGTKNYCTLNWCCSNRSSPETRILCFHSVGRLRPVPMFLNGHPLVVFIVFLSEQPCCSCRSRCNCREQDFRAFERFARGLGRSWQRLVQRHGRSADKDPQAEPGARFGVRSLGPPSLQKYAGSIIRFLYYNIDSFIIHTVFHSAIQSSMKKSRRWPSTSCFSGRLCQENRAPENRRRWRVTGPADFFLRPHRCHLSIFEHCNHIAR